MADKIQHKILKIPLTASKAHQARDSIAKFL